MVTYEVSASVESSVADNYEQFMKGKHLRDVLATGCFVSATLERGGAGKYRALYRARNRHDVDRYQRDHAAAVRQDFAEHLPTGVQLTREVWEELVSVSG
jgi:hypothetical protein